MPKSIDSIGRKPEKKKVEPIAVHKAGEVFRPRGQNPQAGEQIKPKDYVDPKSQEKRARVLSLEEHEASQRNTKRRRKKSFIIVLVSLSIMTLLAGISVSSYSVYKKNQQKKKQAEVEAELAKDPKNIYKVVQDQQANDNAQAAKNADQKLAEYKASIDGKPLADDPKLFDDYRNAAIVASQKGDSDTAKKYADQVILYYDKNPDLKNYSPGTLLVMQKISSGEKYESK